MPRLLLVSYYYPPSGGSGVQRPLKMSRYLPDFGWDVTVLTVDPDYAAYPNPDPSLLADVPPAVRVVRTRAWDPYAAYARLLGKQKADLVGVGGLKAAGDAGARQRLAAWLRANVFLPDARVGWVPFALRRARQLHADRPFDAVFTTAPPMSLHLVGLAFAPATGVPWVADFRDPWTDRYDVQRLPRARAALAFDRRMERAVLRRASRVVTVSPALARSLEVRRGASVDVLPNGFDEADFAAPAPALDTGVFTLAFVGNLVEHYDLAALWAALARLKAEGALEGVRLRLVGNLAAPLRAAAEAAGLAPHLDEVPYVPHAEAVAEMRRASALLLPIPRADGAEGILTGKLFEYLAAGRPLVGIGPPEGDAAEIVASAEAGAFFGWDDADGLHAYLARLLAAHRAGTPALGAAPRAARAYSRRGQAEALSGLLHDAMDGAR